MKMKERRNVKGEKPVPSRKGACRKLIRKVKDNKKAIIRIIHLIITFGILVTVLAISEAIKSGDFGRFTYPKKTTAVVTKIEPEKVVALEAENNQEEVVEEQPAHEETKTEEVEQITEIKQEVYEKPAEVEVSNGPWNYRLTSYYTGDYDGSSAVTASGKTTNEFQVNEKGWYTYQGKLVIATASDRLKSWSSYSNSTARTFDLYQTLILEIDGVRYEAIVLDVCGAAMKRDIIDLFVSNSSSVKDTQIQVYLP